MFLCRRVSSFYSPSSTEPSKVRRSKVQQARKTKMMEVTIRSVRCTASSLTSTVQVSVSEFDVSTIVAAVPAQGMEIARTPELK